MAIPQNEYLSILFRLHSIICQNVKRGRAHPGALLCTLSWKTENFVQKSQRSGFIFEFKIFWLGFKTSKTILIRPSIVEICLVIFVMYWFEWLVEIFCENLNLFKYFIETKLKYCDTFWSICEQIFFSDSTVYLSRATGHWPTLLGLII